MGTRDDARVEEALARLTARVRPEVRRRVGRSANRGRRKELERAASILRLARGPVVAVPGNHDLPYTFPGPVHVARGGSSSASGGRPSRRTRRPPLHVVGLNSARPYRHQSGALRDEQLRDAAARLAQAAPGAYRVVVLHHHMIGAPWRAARKRPVARRNHVLHELVGAGADLIVAGHIHQAAVSERHEFEVVTGEAPAGRRLDRTRPRAAAPPAARRGARAARLRDRRRHAHRRDAHLAAATTGSRPRGGPSSAAAAASPPAR